VRSAVPAGSAADGVRVGPQARPAAGADDGLRVFAVAIQGADPRPERGGPVRVLWQLIARLGAVPRVLVWDGEGAIGRWRADGPS
jgi:hypothetical protein